MHELPNELVNNIAQYCKTPDFISLRNTCRRFRTINYYPHRDIVIGYGSKVHIKLKIESKVFLCLSLALLLIAFITLTLGIILLCIDMGNTRDVITAQNITGIIFLTFTLLTIIIDVVFILTTIRLTRTKVLNRITV